MTPASLPTQLSELTATDALTLFRQGELSPVELTRDCLERIDTLNPKVNAFVHIAHDGAMKAAKGAEARWMNGSPCGPLDGVPTTLKDLTLSRGMPTRYGSATTSPDGGSDVDSPVAASLRKAGAVFLGKTTSPEYGWKGVTDNPLHGVTRNPWNTALTSGGSSGGAGAAAALNLGMLHQGSDAGGSIRIPCSFTGTFGLKPTFGWIPQWPTSAMSTLSHLGPMTRTASDSALMLASMARPDARDGLLGNPHGIDWNAPLPLSLEGWKIAYSPTLGYVDVAQDIRLRVDEAVALLSRLGADVIEIDPGFACPLDTFNTLWFAGATQVVEKMTDSQRDQMDPGLLDIAERGSNISLSQYLAARRERTALCAHMQSFHEQWDLLVTPTLPISPFAAGHNVPPGEKYTDWMHWTPFSYPFNLTQQPAASLPCGLDDNGLPVGLHLVGGKFQDMKVMHAAMLLEEMLPGLVYPRP
ncbi:MAG: amidase [Cobetia sp.]|uniref:amidase n=1 Tax=Cobetia sp. TaxID=1873876 RepID=UPI000C568A09|nr:amidase [Cobetia sp.]MBF10570.1 amidase [Cobetia sp.]MBK10892.1 amidase [Cobetia sp.]HBJ27559.1 amidase [Cobetia sp.]|tara:strand:- start:393 stop:1805 length:1413 start_codon:yes stop_codon:yes gene_type:complete